MGEVEWVGFAGWVAKICYKIELEGCIYGGGREEEEDRQKQRRERETSGGCHEGGRTKGSAKLQKCPSSPLFFFWVSQAI